MSDDENNSVTHWIKELGTSNHDDASRQLWERYFERIALMAQGWLRDLRRAPADGEDVALSVFENFFRGAAAGRFERLNSRDDLWRLLLTLAVRKTQNVKRDELRQKRGGGLVTGPSPITEDYDVLAQVTSQEPTPELAAVMADQTRKLLDCLADDSLRTVVRLRLEGYSNVEIATSLDCAVRTVERKLEVIRKRWLAEELS